MGVLVFALALLLGPPLAPPLAPPLQADARPNILLAIADDLNPGHLGFSGNALARTPRLDRLASEGLLIPTLYAQPVCRPALATLLTGRWPHETGILCNIVPAPLAPAGALPALLEQKGYATYCAGKFWEGDLPGFGFDAPAENDERFARSVATGRRTCTASWSSAQRTRGSCGGHRACHTRLTVRPCASPRTSPRSRSRSRRISPATRPSTSRTSAPAWRCTPGSTPSSTTC